MTRADLLNLVAERIGSIDNPGTVRVGIDGVDGAGKTTLADELADYLRRFGRPIIRASIDGFHNPRSVRYRNGPESPEGYYLDSFNYEALIDSLLKPLGPEGTGHHRTAIFDYRRDEPIQLPVMKAEPRSILLFDGVFLLRPELQPYWDYSIFVEAGFDVTLARVMSRDIALFGTRDNVVRRYKSRYIPGQKLYLAECRPQMRASLVIGNGDYARPIILAERTAHQC